MPFCMYTAVVISVIALLITCLAGNRAFCNATWVNSPRAIASGGCSVSLVDGQAALHNPGAVGLFHLRNWLGVSILSRPCDVPVFQENSRTSSFAPRGSRLELLNW